MDGDIHTYAEVTDSDGYRLVLERGSDEPAYIQVWTPDGERDVIIYLCQVDMRNLYHALEELIIKK